MDGFLNQVMISYNCQNDELAVILIDASHQASGKPPEPILTVNVKLSDYIEMDNGSAYLGFT